jgi:hypothetical protein
MDEAACIREFEKLAERLGIEIRYVPGIPSGLCVVKGKKVFFADRNLNRNALLEVFSREFRNLDLEGMFIVPVLRKYLGGDDGVSDW